MYHHIRLGTNYTGMAKDLSCDPEVFNEHLDYIQMHGYTTITFVDVASGLVVDKPIILTFDDGNGSQYEAFWELKKRGMVGVFFITINMIGGKHYLSWDQVKEMSDAGMEIGSHTMTHPNLKMLGDNKIFWEFHFSKTKIEEMTGKRVLSIAYPYGSYNERVVQVAKRAGYVFGRTTDEYIKVVKEGDLKLPIVYIHNVTKNLEGVI